MKPFRIYISIAAIHLLAILLRKDLAAVEFVTKSLLLPSLAVSFWSLTRNNHGSFRNLILCALIFSWIGDVVLLFQRENANFFLVGLVSFLVAHICYIIAFRKTTARNDESILKEKPWLIAPFACYGAGFFMVIKSGLGEMMLPVIFYMVIILLMGVTALNRFRKVVFNSFVMIFTGALFFMLSDSLLAVNKFKIHFPFADFLIMLTYILAQLLIVKGSVQQLISEQLKEVRVKD